MRVLISLSTKTFSVFLYMRNGFPHPVAGPRRLWPPRQLPAAFIAAMNVWVGYQAQREDIERRIEDLKRCLNGAQDEQKPKRQLSAKGRAAISKATKERWRRARAAGRSTLG